ncbi:hypothetical protein LB465_15625 [Salegentibacter sp. LM13S]|uniref:hypothetical protein n=1 Tax=Salegentibacter lacus TaxID=2873599 RepID=UPI001CCCDB86|nr:hypothetical protein [Salegentibacter lacus]MBZ9632211.1 hypothetical protein [Salegentibacter lacus]
MNNKFQYRLSNELKKEIAKNLIDILCGDVKISEPTRIFISNWILTGPDEKRKAFYDVWEIVLKNYLPTKRPILFRSCERISKNSKIKSFTGRIECAKRFCKGKGSLIICDTKESLRFEEELYKIGSYKNTFYPLVDVLLKAKRSGKSGFSQRILNDYIKEDEYIMRFEYDNIYTLKWTR